MQSIRTFIALDISSQTKGAALKAMEKLRGAGAKVRWTEPEQMHLTLHFLGDVPNTQLADVCQAAADAAAQIEPFEVEFRGLGAFPSLDRPRVLWLGIREGKEQLQQLHQALFDTLDPLGISLETRRYNPHLTLGRIKEGGPNSEELAQLLAEYRDYPGDVSFADEVVVYSSTLERSGPIYDVMAIAPLGG